jgi:beta-glucanase (GH16 family)
VFAADFSTPTLPAACTPYDGQPGRVSGAYYRPDEVQVSGGMLRLSLRTRAFGDRPFTAGGLGCLKLAQRYGRYEYRARVAPVVGVDSYVALWPFEGSASDATLVEVFAPSGQDDRVPRAHISNSFGSGSNHRALAAGIDGFHDFTIDWVPSGLRVYVDGEVIFTDTRSSGKDRWFGFAVSTGDGDSGLAAQDELPTEFLIDWIRVYLYDPGGSAAGPPLSAGAARARADRSGRRDAGTVILGVVAAGAMIVVASIGAVIASRRLGNRHAAHRA